MITSELIDPDEAGEVLNDPEVYDRIVDDYCPERIEWPSYCTYLGGYVDQDLASVSIVHETERGYQFHFQVLQEYRDHKQELLRQALEYYLPVCKSLWCEIPDLYPGVYKLAREFGFREVEVKPDHFLKNGQRYDCRVLEL